MKRTVHKKREIAEAKRNAELARAVRAGFEKGVRGDRPRKRKGVCPTCDGGGLVALSSARNAEVGRCPTCADPTKIKYVELTVASLYTASCVVKVPKGTELEDFATLSNKQLDAIFAGKEGSDWSLAPTLTPISCVPVAWCAGITDELTPVKKAKR